MVEKKNSILAGTGVGWQSLKTISGPNKKGRGWLFWVPICCPGERGEGGNSPDTKVQLSL